MMRDEFGRPMRDVYRPRKAKQDFPTRKILALGVMLILLLMAYAIGFHLGGFREGCQ